MALDKCPVGSRFLSFKGEATAPEVLLCESTNPHEYMILFPDGRKRHYPIIPMDNNKDIVAHLKMLNWDPVRLNHVKSVHQTNVENENRYFEMRQNYQAVSILDLINNNAGSIGAIRKDPCYSRLSVQEWERDQWVNSRKYLCRVKVSEDQKEKLGIEKSGILSIAQMERLLQGSTLKLMSKTSSESVTPNEEFRIKDFAEYELSVVKENTTQAIYLDGTCREQRNLSAFYEEFNERQRTPKADGFVNPLDFKVNLAGMDVGFPLDVDFRPTGTQNRNGDDQYDIDVNLGLSTDVRLAPGLNMNIQPKIVMPFARDVSGISDTLNINRLTRDFIPTEVGVRFNLEF